MGDLLLAAATTLHPIIYVFNKRFEIEQNDSLMGVYVLLFRAVGLIAAVLLVTASCTRI